MTDIKVAKILMDAETAKLLDALLEDGDVSPNFGTEQMPDGRIALEVWVEGVPKALMPKLEVVKQ